MNKNVAILLAAGVLLVVALVVFYVDGNGSLFSSGGSEVSLSIEEQKAERTALKLLKAAQTACLSGVDTEAGVNVDLSTDFLKELKASSGVHKKRVLGAVGIVNDNLKHVENNKIRECLEKEMKYVRACLMGDCSTASLPSTIEFQFTYKPGAGSENLMKNHVAFALENRIKNHTIFLEPGSSYYVDTIPLLARGKKRNAAIYSVVRQSFLPASTDFVQFCLSRASVIPDSGKNYTTYDCEQGGSCTHNNLSPKWFDLCPVANSELNYFLSPLIRTAYADDTVAWAIPSLDTLQQREDLFGIGYTRFKVEAATAMNKNYDGFYYDLEVNGRQANVNGLPGSYRAQEHDFSKPVAMEFGLQNLNFSGVNDGCDEIALTLHFVKDGEEVGAPISLRRSYVALRDARDKNLTSDGQAYRWTGKYQRAPKMYDSEVFISSILIAKNLDFQANAQKLKNAKHTISRMKRDFDALGLKFEGRPLVAVIRPPLTQLSYGLAIGMVEETQQIRFTYENATAERLKKFLLQQRDRGGAYHSTIADSTFIYTVRGSKSYMASPPVCADDTI
jgi:hypothetical protein